MLLATVKGDVHDIGKNIVGRGAGLQRLRGRSTSGSWCTPTASCRRPSTRRSHAVGLSGLITPSLDEMVFVAREMQRRGFTMPLLIGGATTSPQHTAVKIAPEYSGTTVHVLDASRAAGVVSTLLDPRRRPGLRRARTGSCSESLREQVRRPARAAAAQLRGSPGEPPRAGLARGRTCRRPSFVGPPRHRGARSRNSSRSSTGRSSSTRGISKGKVPQIFAHPEYGAAARELYDNAQALLRAHRARERSLHGSRGLRLLAGRERRATTSCCSPTRAERARWPGSRCCASRTSSPTAGRTARWPTSWRRGTARLPGLRRRVRGDGRASAPTRSRRASRRTTTTTTRSW